MNHLFNLSIIGLLLLNVLGLTLLCMRYTRLPYGLAKAVALVGGCMVFFFIEHVTALGNLGGLLAVSTPLSCFVIWKMRSDLRGNLEGSLVFLAGFFYALGWRYFYPDISPSSERIADLNFVASYMQGGRLPVADLWLNPYKLTQYYSFQYYGAALMGRILQIPSGMAYNLAYCLLVGLVMAPAFEFVRVFAKSRGTRVVILAVFLVGGTGASILTPFMLKNELPHHSMRFIGDTSSYPDSELTDTGKLVRQIAHGPGPFDEARRAKILNLPLETFSYVAQLGDYHPVLGGFLLLTMALAAFGVLLGTPELMRFRVATGTLAATVPLSLATHTWVFPLQTILVMGCVVFLWKYRRILDGISLFAGFAGASLLLYPFFSYFIPNTVGSTMELKLLTKTQHPNVWIYLMQFWPALTFTVLGWFSVGPKQREFRWFVILAGFFLLMMEIVYVDDVLADSGERFNSAIKWWPWVTALVLLLLSPLAAASERRPVRIATCTVLLMLLFYVKILATSWFLGLRQPGLAVGQLDGAAWLRNSDVRPEEPTNQGVTASMINYLQARPGGVCLEQPIDDNRAFVETGTIPLFTGHPAVFGWVSHEQLWRGNQLDIEQRWRMAKEFFSGEVAAPLDFLESQNVRYILWPGGRGADPALFDKISRQIESRYLFVRFEEAEPTKGIWERRDKPF